MLPWLFRSSQERASATRRNSCGSAERDSFGKLRKGKAKSQGEKKPGLQNEEESKPGSQGLSGDCEERTMQPLSH
ncbi:MAG: hypothetical protein Cons2KO_01440 [Congregibacter sp.]